MYNNIFNANLVIDKLRHEERTLFEEGVREIMLAEMLAMRAYMYFDLVRMFNEPYAVNAESNNVPWKTSWDATIGERHTSERLLAQLMDELAEANPARNPRSHRRRTPSRPIRMSPTTAPNA